MTDIKTLFHQPELLDDNELRSLRSKIAVQGNLKWGFAACGAIAVAIHDQARFRTLAQSQLRIAGAGVLGFCLGSYAALQLTSTWIKPKMEDEIMRAHEQRQIDKFYTCSGFVTSYTSSNANMYGYKST